MQRDEALAIIRSHRAELERLGVLSASLFGSVARGEARPGSDLDVAVRLEDIPSGFATFGRLDRVRRHLSQLLGVRVDVVPEPETPGPLKIAIDKDRRLAFAAFEGA